tara:strand:+ start:73 stop:759 length:687 start_codon:yes stop_codon:yes gene_type:complete
MTRDELNQQLKNLETTALVPKHHRSGDDGSYGRALEESLGVEENNFKTGDLVLDDATRVELKTTNGKSKVTLFSKEPKWTSNEAIKKMRDFFDSYSYDTPSGRPKLNVAMKPEVYNNQGLRIMLKGEKLFIEHQVDGYCAEWSIEDLISTAAKKLDELVIVERDSNGTVVSSTISTGFKKETFKKMIMSGQIVVETRLSMKAGNKLKNRGTCFRVSPKKVEEIYKEEK